LKTFFSGLNNINPDKTLYTQTEYSYRFFYHLLYAYDYNYSWEDVGQSTSKYYYKHLYMRYYNNYTGEYETATYDYNHSHGFSPCIKSTAPNYMNYSGLSQCAYNAWSDGGNYSERYPLGG